MGGLGPCIPPVPPPMSEMQSGHKHEKLKWTTSRSQSSNGSCSRSICRERPMAWL